MVVMCAVPAFMITASFLPAVTIGAPVIDAISAATSSPNPGGAFSPVPTAVPPIASFSRPWVACSTSVMASSRAPA